MASDIEKAVKDARIAASLAALCVLLVGVLLMIDGQRNRWMAEKIGEVQRIFAEFQGLVMGYAGPGAAARPLWAVALITAAELAGTGLLVWSQMPSQEREWILLAARQWCRSTGHGLGVRAWRAGRAGMAEELAGRDPSAHYLSAEQLSRWRDRLEAS